MLKRIANPINKYVMTKAILDFKVKVRNTRRHKLFIFTKRNGVGILLNMISSLFKKTLQTTKLGNALVHFQQNLDPTKQYFQQFVKAFNITTKTLGESFSDINKKGPLVIYANHPFSGIDGFALASEIEKVRPDVKVLAASFLENFPGLKDNAFIIKVIKRRKFIEENKKVYEAVNKHIRDGKALLIFPAGIVSSWSPDNCVYAIDGPWKNGFIRFGANSKLTQFLPVFIHGEPSLAYLKLRLKSRLLSNFFVIREFANQINTSMSFYLGKSIAIKQLETLNQSEKISYLRAKLYELGTSYFWGVKGRKQHLGVNYSLLAPLLTIFENRLLSLLDPAYLVQRN